MKVETDGKNQLVKNKLFLITLEIKSKPKIEKLI